MLSFGSRLQPFRKHATTPFAHSTSATTFFAAPLFSWWTSRRSQHESGSSFFFHLQRNSFRQIFFRYFAERRQRKIVHDLQALGQFMLRDFFVNEKRYELCQSQSAAAAQDDAGAH